MDRQQLLEQKRQRLQELKQRRNQHKEDVNVDAIIDTLTKQSVATSTTSVDVSTQTTEVRRVVEGVRYDKAIQTIAPEKEQEEAKAEVVTASAAAAAAEDKLVGKHELSETKLNQALANSLKLLNKLTVKSTIELEQTTVQVEHAKSGFFQEIDSHSGHTGSISDIDVCGSLIAIAYANSKYSAIVYAGTTPQHFLTSISQITTIQFDINNSNRIITGCANGSISIYELSNQLSPVVSPTLTTPLYSTTLFNNNFALHTTPILSITQLKINDNNCLLTVCKQGIINLWSSNLLAVPKTESIILFPKKLNSTFLSRAIFTSIQTHYVDTAYLNSLVFVGDGKFYQLDKDITPYITNELESGIATIINDVTVLDSMLITAHMDWNIRIWKDECKTVPVPYLVDKIVVRPDSRQFITVSHQPMAKVDLWDISKRLYTPIVTVCETAVDTVAFNETGTQLLLGKQEGFTILSIDELTVDEVEYDDGI
ncbi:uncharacterized protein SPAPADRAFT_48813 [Spathaspora passalidarum NRRL Y-27907]|uniref:Uncharacterized protein n=1 Tax=Spathaspora passalidarum (strain NRRL Y-27907 / 11-Y1) TaxID=619300 RepID=G3AIC0_SPAPN|nr:uncharacterized protein SPAPADRAFT_48813 [Spathaspora passalidarum NRRL Y-27907]EGW33689.1 hypothetical protein SPAPADRAFT_48813 [Spathaspora passalidarum NRRL Y-27907]